MQMTLDLPDKLAQGGLLKGCPPLRPGVRLRVIGGKFHGRRAVYVGPHANPHGEWSGKLRVMLCDTHHEAVLAPAQIREDAHAP